MNHRAQTKVGLIDGGHAATIPPMSRLLYILTVALGIAGLTAQWGACCATGSLHRCADLATNAAAPTHAVCACHDEHASHSDESMPTPSHECGGDPLLYIDAPQTVVERDRTPTNFFDLASNADRSLTGRIMRSSLIAWVRAPLDAPAMRAQHPVYRL